MHRMIKVILTHLNPPMPAQCSHTASHTAASAAGRHHAVLHYRAPSTLYAACTYDFFSPRASRE